MYSELFENDMDVFFAKSDLGKTPLFRARDLSKKLGCKTNKVRIYKGFLFIESFDRLECIFSETKIV